MKIGYCLTSDELPSDDNFVGIRFINNKPQVVFPHGFKISEDESERRQDTFRLLSTIIKLSEHREGEKSIDAEDNIKTFPLSSYQYVINDYLKNGFYVENETRYIKSNKGKINWKRTINLETPQIDGNNVVYLELQVKQNRINENNLLTQIHKYCVYKSFFYFGWLYLSYSYLPEKPQIKEDTDLFVATLKGALNNTFNDEKKLLFQSMINILLNDETNIDTNNTNIGINKFDHVWESLVDYTYGEANKEKYFPHGYYFDISSNKNEMISELRPDTIMKYKGKTFVLDAKYYQYGLTNNIKSLPATESLQKQVTYGKYIDEHFYEADENKVFNAFVLPYMSDLEEENSIRTEFKTIGTVDWEKYNKDTKNYAYILCMLVDTKDIIKNYVKHNDNEIEELAVLIEKSLNKNKDKINELYKK